MDENDVFISYASPDDRPLSEGQEGWVRSFERLLRNHLETFLGDRKVAVWFDDRKIDSLTPITKVILTAVERSRLMVSVISPSYVNSSWCRDELNHFRATKEQGGGLLLGDKSLLVKVNKIPVEADELPEVFRDLDLKGVEFFKPQGTDKMPQWFGLEESGEARQLFIDRVRSVAYSISRVIKQLKRPAAAPGDDARPAGSYIYFAEPTPDLKEQCGLLKLELEQRGHAVYSLDEDEGGLPRSLPELQRKVRDNMRGCRLAVHMVGAEYGEAPADDIRSYSFVENMIATEIERDADFSRLIWIPQGTRPREKAQEKFLELIRTSNWPGRTEWLENSFEQFKAVVEEKTRPARPAAAAPAPQPGGRPRVYVVFDRQDAARGRDAGVELAAKGCEVIGPTLSGDESSLAEAHRAKLKLCDAVLIVWDKVPDTWVYEKVGDLEKIRGYGREEPFRASAVLISGEPTFEKGFYFPAQTLVIKRLDDGTAESSLDQFVAQLK
jgi:hypothetical protein